MKEYFSHDFGARNDPRLVDVMMQLGHEGKSVYWDLIEMLYEQGGHLTLSQCKGYAFALRTHTDLIEALINNFGLFANDGSKFWSESVLRRLDLRKAKSAKASESASKRWAKSEGNANGMRTHSEGNAIKEKESKEKESKQASRAGVDSASQSESQTSAATEGAPAKPREYRVDEAPVFLATNFFAFLASIGHGNVDKAMYLLRIPTKAADDVRRKKIKELATDDEWKRYITSYLDFDKSHNKLLLPEPSTPYRNPNGSFQAPASTVMAGNINDRIAAQAKATYL